MSSSKSFASLHEDYAFFETHATEAEADACAYLPHVFRYVQDRNVLRLLDFGGGDGRFTTHLLGATRLPPDRLALSLVEPDDDYRQKATARLQSFATQPVEAWAHLPAHLEAHFDIILANHVFYYVVELEETLIRLLRALARPGLFLASMAGHRNDLIQIWDAYFELLGIPVPFHTAEDVEAVLARLDLQYQTEEVQYELVFPDSEAHRIHLLRFLLGSYFDERHRAAMLDLFEPHRQGEFIMMNPVHQHFVISCESP